MDQNSQNNFLVFDHVIRVMVQKLDLNDRNKVYPVYDAIFPDSATYAFYFKNKFFSKAFFRFKQLGLTKTHCKKPYTLEKLCVYQ